MYILTMIKSTKSSNPDLIFHKGNNICTMIYIVYIKTKFKFLKKCSWYIIRDSMIEAY